RHFDESPAEGAHPQFRLHELLRTGTDKTTAPPTQQGARAPSAFQLLAYFQRPTDSVPRWQDAARVQFNHAKHLVAKYDENGKLIARVRDQHGQMIDLSQNCQACHQPDGEHRYMLPITYETHCRNCHPLTFDIERFPGRVAPHQEPALVRGFLTDLYAWGKS